MQRTHCPMNQEMETVVEEQFFFIHLAVACKILSRLSRFDCIAMSKKKLIPQKSNQWSEAKIEGFCESLKDS